MTFYPFEPMWMKMYEGCSLSNIRLCSTVLFVTSTYTSERCLSQSLWKYLGEKEILFVVPFSFVCLCRNNKHEFNSLSGVACWIPYLVNFIFIVCRFI